MSKYYKNIFNNKRINGSASLGAADPFLIKVNGYYYLTCTRPDGLVLMKSFDLIHWDNVNDNGIVGVDETLKHAFAPEICYFDNNFYATASPSGLGHYIYKSKDIEGPYKRVTNNFHELIDGSFFIDSNEEKYFLRATETGIEMKHFTAVEEKMSFDKSIYFKDAIIGNWTEGPYLIKRYGKYYLTFTGTHFLSDAYRVNYVSGNSINESTSLKHQGLLLINTSDEFYGLGHSMNILGPNLDAYYIVYHNMMPNKNRYMNISRLMFDNEGHMLVNGTQVDNNFKIERPYFEKFINASSFLSDESIDSNNFSIEYNFKSKEINLIFGYIDKYNYQFISFSDNEIIFNNVINDELNREIIHKLNNKYNFDTYHSLRIQYKPNKMSIYLDLIELNDNISIKLNKGKIGFINNKLNNAYLAYSNYSFGSSDTENCKVNRFYLSNMQKKKNVYSTNIFVNKEGYYNFYFKGKNYEVDNINIDKKDVSDLVYLRKGIHRFSFDLNKGKIDEIGYYQNKLDFKELNSSNYLESMNIYGSYINKKDGIYFENDRNALLTKFDSYEYIVSCDLEVIGNPIKDEHVSGLIVDVNNYSKSNSFETWYSFNGYAILVNSKYAYIVEANFYHSKVFKKIKLSQNSLNLKIHKSKKNITFYINNKEVYKLDRPSTFVKGKVGLYMNHSSVLYKSFNLLKGGD